VAQDEPVACSCEHSDKTGFRDDGEFIGIWEGQKERNRLEDQDVDGRMGWE
jgi:hypothetical protein